MQEKDKGIHSNRDAALTRFVRDHQIELVDKGATKSAVRQLRLDFARKHNLSTSAHFSNSEIAERVLTIIVKARREATEEELVKIALGIPFLAEELPSERVLEAVRLGRLGRQPQLKPEELGKLQSDEYISKVEERFVQRAQQEAEHKLEEERRQLLSTISALNETHKTLKAEQSQLDSLPPDADLDQLIETTPEVDPQAGPAYWWKDLGLETDPFSSNRGLTGIPEGKYESVVVQTPFVKAYVQRIDEQTHAFFGKTIVILGEFGSGKTTLFKLLANRAGRKGVFPIFTAISPDSSVANLTLQFVSQVNAVIRDSFPMRPEPELSARGERVDEISRALDMMTAALKSAVATKGYLVFVDGLHTSDSYRRQSLEFLQHLQTLQERMEDRGLPCGILVAGALLWQRELTANKALGGSVYSIETVPALSEDSAVEAVVRRIHSFVPVGRPAPTVVRAPLRQAFELLTERLLRPPTFRDFLDHVRDRFVAREYANLGVSISLHFETIEKVRKLMDGSPLSAGYGRLSNPLIHSAAFRNALRNILPMISAKKGLEETEPIFQRNKGAFALLRKEDWIVSRANKTRTGLVWHLSPALVSFLQASQDTDRISPTEALESLFTDIERTRPQEAETIYGPVLRQLRSMTSAWRTTWPEISEQLDLAVTRITNLEKACENIEWVTSKSSLEDVRSSTIAIIQALLIVDGGLKTKEKLDPSEFSSAWFAPENAAEILSMLVREAPTSQVLSESYGLLHEHAEAVGDLCNLLLDLVRGEGVARLTGRLLSAEDLSKLHASRTLFLSQQYPQSVEKLCETVEAKLRDVVYPALRFAAGSGYAKYIPSDIAGRFTQPPRGHPRVKRGYDRNLLYDMSRSEYSKVLFQPSVLKVLASDDEMARELAALKDPLELLFSLGDRKGHNDRPAFFRDHSTEIADALKAAPRLLELLNRSINWYVSGTEFEMRAKSDESVEVCFGPGRGMSTQTYTRDEAEELINHVLERLERDPLRIPALESGLLAIDQVVEDSLSFLRGCVQFKLSEIVRRDHPFRVEFRIMQKGREHLARSAAHNTKPASN